MFEKAISQISFPRGFPILKLLKLASNADFDGVELRLSERGEFSLASSESDIRKIKRAAEELGLKICSVVGGLQWKYPLSSSDESIRRAGIKAAKRAVKYASILGADVVLIVPAVVTEELSYEKAWELALKSVVEIGELSEKLGVFVGIENVWNKFIFTPLEMLRFVREANSMLSDDPIAVYFDVGNVVPFGYPEHWIECLGDYIKAIHIKDIKIVNGVPTSVLPPRGDVNWKSVMRALKDVKYKGCLTAEVSLPELNLEDTLGYLSSFIDILMRM